MRVRLYGKFQGEKYYFGAIPADRTTDAIKALSSIFSDSWSFVTEDTTHPRDRHGKNIWDFVKIFLRKFWPEGEK